MHELKDDFKQYFICIARMKNGLDVKSIALQQIFIQLAYFQKIYTACGRSSVTRLHKAVRKTLR